MNTQNISTLDFPLNGICPYFTLFPLSFPHQILVRHSQPEQVVLDPFCGRGTTNFAARLQGLNTIGIDSSQVAVAITESKMAVANPKDIVRLAQTILNHEAYRNIELPTGEFWEYAFHPDILLSLCILRAALLQNCQSNTRRALRGILLGALHGPIGKRTQSYFSNQFPSLFAPKPDYSVRFWKKHRLHPPKPDMAAIIQARAQRAFHQKIPKIESAVLLADSRQPAVFSAFNSKVDWIISSPPYYGMRHYLAEQWLRLWFLGGKPQVCYRSKQLDHRNPEVFAENLRMVWRNLLAVSRKTANLIIRFGGIGSRNVVPLEVIKLSLKNSGWKIKTVQSAGFSTQGNRQCRSFLKTVTAPMEEYDIWANPDY